MLARGDEYAAEFEKALCEFNKFEKRGASGGDVIVDQVPGSKHGDAFGERVVPIVPFDRNKQGMYDRAYRDAVSSGLIAAERERCAKVAEEFTDFEYADPAGYRGPDVVVETASMKVLATRIRSGE